MEVSAENIVSLFKGFLEDGFVEGHTTSRMEGVKRPIESKCAWIKVKQKYFHRTVTFLKDISSPHISTPMASKELEGGGLELIYPFTIFSGEGNFRELPVIISVELPHDDLRIRSVADIVPGIIFMERETQEMLGVEIESIPDGRRLFTPVSIRGTYPMRGKPFEKSDNEAEETGS